MTTCRSSRQRDARCWSEARRCCCKIWQLDLRGIASMRFFDWPAPDSVGYQDSISIVIVEHNLDLVLALADRVFALERGAVFHQGPASQLLMLPAEVIDKTNYKAWLVPVDQRTCPECSD